MGRGYNPMTTEDWNKLMRANVVARVFPKGMAVPGGGAQQDTTPIPPASPTPTPSITPTITPTNSPTPTPTPTPSPIPFDSDAEAYLNRVLTAGGTLDATISGATDTLFKSLKSNSLYTKLIAMYPVLGSASGSNGLDALNNYNGIFNGGWTYDDYNNPDGVNGRFSTEFDASLDANFGINDASIGLYINSDVRPTETGTTNIQVDIGQQGSNTYKLWLSPYGNATYQTRYGVNTSQIANRTSVVSDTRGLWISSKTGTTTSKLFRNGSLLDSWTFTGINGKPNAKIQISAKHDVGVGYFDYSTRKWSFAFISQGFSDSEVSTLSNIINTFQTTLSRNTYS